MHTQEWEDEQAPANRDKDEAQQQQQQEQQEQQHGVLSGADRPPTPPQQPSTVRGLEVQEAVHNYSSDMCVAHKHKHTLTHTHTHTCV
jgi:hypothetical protein